MILRGKYGAEILAVAVAALLLFIFVCFFRSCIDEKTDGNHNNGNSDSNKNNNFTSRGRMSEPGLSFIGSVIKTCQSSNTSLIRRQSVPQFFYLMVSRFHHILREPIGIDLYEHQDMKLSHFPFVPRSPIRPSFYTE